jgi:hypothetical protein
MLKPPSPPLPTSKGTWARSNVEEAHAFAEHLADVLQPRPSGNEPEEEEALIQHLESTHYSNRQSNASKELKFKKSSAIYILRNHWVTKSSLVKFLKDYLLLE